MLNVFQREEIWNVCCVVTRYFGGILLGSRGADPGLHQGARDALCAAGCAVMGLWTLWDVPCTYPLFERMKLEIAACGGVVQRRGYGADIVLRAAFPRRRRGAVLSRLTDLSAGALEMVAAGENSCPVPGRRSYEKRTRLRRVLSRLCCSASSREANAFSSAPD